MSSFVTALASIALILVNMGIGWALAKWHSRRHPGAALHGAARPAPRE